MLGLGTEGFVEGLRIRQAVWLRIWLWFFEVPNGSFLFDYYNTLGPAYFGHGFKTTRKWGMKPPPSRVVAIEPWSGFMPSRGVFIHPFGGVG